MTPSHHCCPRTPSAARSQTEKRLAWGPGGGNEHPWSAQGRAETPARMPPAPDSISPSLELIVPLRPRGSAFYGGSPAAPTARARGWYGMLGDRFFRSWVKPKKGVRGSPSGPTRRFGTWSSPQVAVAGAGTVAELPPSKHRPSRSTLKMLRNNIRATTKRPIFLPRRLATRS